MSAQFEALWREHPELVQLLGLCPLLGAATSTVNALGLSIATLWVLVGSTVIVLITQRLIAPPVRIAIVLMLIVAQVTSCELLFQAFLPELRANMGVFLPLLVVNCLFIVRMQTLATSTAKGRVVIETLGSVTAFSLCLIGVGTLRELLGTGAVLQNLDQLLPGVSGAGLTLSDNGVLLALLPP
ncbi:MAG: Rnf-Nqr domain containing protein, partial [Pseudomonadota bacterium]